MLVGATRLMENVKQGKGIVIPLAVDLVVIVSAAFFGGSAINRLENVERAVVSLSSTHERVAVLENNLSHILIQQDKMDQKINILLARGEPKGDRR